MSDGGKRAALVRARLALIRIGARLPRNAVSGLRNAAAHVELGTLLSSGADGRGPQIVRDDLAVFDVARRLVRGRRPLYLEFGVFEGRSMRWWSEHLDQPDAQLIGFDSFEGLPEDWQPGFPKGTFKTGCPPRIDDERVSYVAGWFEKTLPTFVMPDHDQLIVNVDCDLYSSAKTVLTWLAPFMRAGTLLYFDEFPVPDHEMRAFRELLQETGLPAMIRAVSTDSLHWLFEIG